MQNGYIERFNRTFRQDILVDINLFEDIEQVQLLAEDWIRDYNIQRPHEALGGMSPEKYETTFCKSLGMPNDLQKQTNIN